LLKIQKKQNIKRNRNIYNQNQKTMSRQFNLKKYLKENRILGQSGTSLLREQQEKGDVAVERPNGSVVKYFNNYEEAKEWVDMNDPDGMVDYNIRNMNEEVVYEQEEVDIDELFTYHKEGKKVTKEMWDKMDSDEREEVLLTFFKDPDDVENYIDSEWNDLPDGAANGLFLSESVKEVVYETSYGDYTEQPGNLRDALGDLFQTAYTAGVQGKSDFPTYLIDDALDLMKNSNLDLSEQEEEEVEDVEDIEGGEEEIEEPLDTEEPISDDEEELQDTLTKAYNQAEKIGDTKLTQQISNTITYYVKTLLRNQ